ncbi:hypothetical protein C1H46_031032 [Malus baccata]|uniref:Uncharacterized protein n=1 Tax=Malus baccata TaxID=106549 RepID=A0A540LA81_MALBA|nr:hypothetical protein C1H46_031032 [Malus baccata]
MAGREVREYTNLTDPKDKKWGKGKDKIDDEDITFQRMVAKVRAFFYLLFFFFLFFSFTIFTWVHRRLDGFKDTETFQYFDNLHDYWKLCFVSNFIFNYRICIFRFYSAQLLTSNFYYQSPKDYL